MKPVAVAIVPAEQVPYLHLSSDDVAAKKLDRFFSISIDHFYALISVPQVGRGLDLSLSSALTVSLELGFEEAGRCVIRAVGSGCTRKMLRIDL